MDGWMPVCDMVHYSTCGSGRAGWVWKAGWLDGWIGNTFADGWMWMDADCYFLFFALSSSSASAIPFEWDVFRVGTAVGWGHTITAAGLCIYLFLSSVLCGGVFLSVCGGTGTRLCLCNLYI